MSGDSYSADSTTHTHIYRKLKVYSTYNNTPLDYVMHPPITLSYRAVVSFTLPCWGPLGE